MTETWKPIPSTGGMYEASSLGRIRSIDREVGHRWGGTATKKGRVLSPIVDRDGYHTVSICRAGTGRRLRVHRLVAETFHPGGCGEVNHKDFDKANNRPENLEWVAHAENQRHAGDGMRFSARRNPARARKMTPESVDALRKARADGATYARLSADFGISTATALRIVRGDIWA